MDNNWNLLLEKAREFNISLNNEQLNLFKLYWQILDKYNSHTNIVSSSDQKTVIKKHFIDSLSIGLVSDDINPNKSVNLIDIGTGGGFPGIPILIANPAWKLCAVDSVGKKTKFIEILVKELGIQDRVEIVTARAEDIAHNQTKREKFDLAVSRAVSQLNILSEFCLPLVKKGGFFAAYKAKNTETEINEAQKALLILGGKVKKIVNYTLPEDEFPERNLILIEKTDNTPLKYPRKAGMPKKLPL